MMKELLAALLLGESNFKVMHWNAHGSKFDSYHKTMADYYELCSDKADEVAEMLIRLGESPLNYSEVLDIIDNSNKEYLVLDSGSKYDADTIKENTDIIFRSILTCIAETLQEDAIKDDITNVGIKASLESMYADIDLQCRYINANR